MTLKRLKFFLIIILCYSFLNTLVTGQKPNFVPATLNKTLIINSLKLEYFQVAYTSIFESNDNELDVNDIDLMDEQSWTQLIEGYDYNVSSTYWLKLDLQLKSDDKQAQILEWIITPDFWFNASIFVKNKFHQTKKITPEWKEYDLSVFTPLQSRIIKHNTPLN